MFVAETSVVEAFRLNQKVAELSAGYGASSVDASEGILAVGGEVSSHLFDMYTIDTEVDLRYSPLLYKIFRIRRFIFTGGMGKLSASPEFWKASKARSLRYHFLRMEVCWLVAM